jgi:NADP-dependent 3-hydroxy acid dehydrogenase YdfG
MSPIAPVWLITANSFSLAKDMALHALIRGHRVIVTGPPNSNLAALENAGAFILETNATEPLTLKQATEEAIATYGSVDILVNAAGIIIEEAIEEATPEEMWDSFNMMLGMLCVTRTVLAFMRRRQTGMIANLGSIRSSRSAASRCGCAIALGCSALANTLRSEIRSSGIPLAFIDYGYFQPVSLELDNDGRDPEPRRRYRRGFEQNGSMKVVKAARNVPK